MENIVLEGKIIQKLDMQEGVSTRGPWKKQEFVIETAEQYPRKVCISCWNEKVDELANFQVGNTTKVSVNIESREYNSRWYTDVKAWRFESAGTATNAPTSAKPEQPSNDNDVIGVTFSSDDDDLPF